MKMIRVASPESILRDLKDSRPHVALSKYLFLSCLYSKSTGTVRAFIVTLAPALVSELDVLVEVFM